ncbi:hypothetical protein KFE25_009289 [Diacronema lutheri]|uniref:Uncharacterized protein n=1 Tax=Diacronema lutheri TaxID=2081491 RepID=A0A8J5XMF4_DIALT|nr:hypothetical protein KFE25_009289 [Diacronema lutheri]
MGAPRKTGQSDDGVAAIRADRYAHWRAELNRELFFETEPRQLASSGLPTAPSLTSAQSPAPLPALGSDAELQAALDRCAPLFAPSADLFAGASDASEKYLRASRALGVKPNPRIAAAFKTSVPAGPDRVAVVAEALDEGTLGALLCALGATPSVTRLKLWHNALSPIGWAMLARLLPGTAISVLECSAQDAAAAVRPYGSWGGGADGAVNGEVQHDCKNNRALVCAPRLLLGGRDHLLVAGVVHVGEGPMSGHLVAIVLRNEAWLPCDDYNIYNVPESDALAWVA